MFILRLRLGKEVRSDEVSPADGHLNMDLLQGPLVPKADGAEGAWTGHVQRHGDKSRPGQQRESRCQRTLLLG